MLLSKVHILEKNCPGQGCGGRDQTTPRSPEGLSWPLCLRKGRPCLLLSIAPWREHPADRPLHNLAVAVATSCELNKGNYVSIFVTHFLPSVGSALSVLRFFFEFFTLPKRCILEVGGSAIV